MPPHPKVLKAFTATRALGIPDEEVKPVLKHLLKVFDKNWDFIEEDNYRTLIDSYYELNRKKRTGDGNGTRTIMHDSERPSKKPHSEEQKYASSSTVRKPESVQLTSSEEDDHITISRFMDLNIYRRIIAESEYSRAQGNDIAGSNISRDSDKLKNVFAPNVPRSAVSTRVCFSSPQISLLRSSPTDTSNKARASCHRSLNYRESSSKSNGCGNSKSDIVIASSSSGEVKLFLNCDSSLGQENFKTPKLDAVLSYVEDKYLQLYTPIRSPLSVAKLLKDICQSYLNLGIDSSANSLRVRSSSAVILKGSITREGPNARRLITNKSDTESATGLVIAEQKPTTSEKKKIPRNIVDITKGTENVRISLVDETGDEILTHFNYIPHNIIYQNARVEVSLARISDEDCCSNCLGNCLSSRLPCSCAGDTGGEFAYTPGGQLKEKFLEACISMKNNPEEQHFIYCEDCPIERTKNEYIPDKCKGHLLRKFIKECWRRCGCDMQCGNRVVQRGVRCNLQVFVTQEGKGWGLRTLEDLPKGTFVCEYIGEIVTNTELYERNMQSTGTQRHTYPVNLDADWGSERGLQDEDALCLDATYNGNVARFINHRCHDANLIDIPVQIETPDRHYYHIALFTTRRIHAYEELNWDYGIDFDDVDHPIKAFRCCCGSQYCRDKKQKGKLKAKLLC